MIYLLGNLIAWKSKSQKLVALLSSEAEYIPILEITKDIIFVKQVLEFLEESIKYPIVIKVNNIRAIYLVENNTLNNHTKHINMRYHFVRNYIEDGTIKIKFVRSENNNSDIFTKNLSKELFVKHSNNFMDCEDNESNARWTT